MDRHRTGERTGGWLSASAAVAWIAALTLAIGTFAINGWRLRTFRVAGPLDMAYYNQQLWNLGRAPVTVRPQNHYAIEGPDAWRTNHLRPITYVLAPLYRAFPSPLTLYAVGSIGLGIGALLICRLTAARSTPAAGAAAALLYATSPPLWLLGSTDFRYLYLGIPVGLLTAHFLDRQRFGPMLASTVLWMGIREPYSIVLAALGVTHVARHRWSGWRAAALAVALGIAWFWVHVVYLVFAYDTATAGKYLWAVLHPVEAYGLVEGAVMASLQREALRLVLHFVPLLLVAWAHPAAALLGLLLLIPPMRMGLFTLHPAVQYVRYISPAVVLLLWGAACATAWLWQRRWGRSLVAIAVCVQSISLGWLLFVGTEGRGGEPRDALLNFPSRYAESDLQAGLPELLENIPEPHHVTAARGVLLNLSPRTVLYDYYQPGPDLRPLDVAQQSDWLVVEKRLFLLLHPVRDVADLTWQSILRTVGSTGVRDRSAWIEFVQWLQRARSGGAGWHVVYEGADLLVLKRAQPQ